MKNILKLIIWIIVISLLTFIQFYPIQILFSFWHLSYFSTEEFLGLFTIVIPLISPIIPILIFQFITYHKKQLSFDNLMARIIVIVSPIISMLFMYIRHQYWGSNTSVIHMVSFSVFELLPYIFSFLFVGLVSDKIRTLIEARQSKRQK